jgi:protein-tyrosine phosphatase/nicotinamidase-related amidase
MSTHHAVLITQCLQRDFVDPVSPFEPLPNALHVGPEESARLLGAVPADGPIAQLLRWARARPTDAFDVLHIRDAHDPTDPAQADHLRTFGRHCVRGEPGAALVLGLDEEVGARDNERFVDATGLNDFEGTTLAQELARIRERAGGKALRVAVVGVWTDAKVSFLLYDLKTRMAVNSLATCSALTASSARVQHFNALDQLRRILGVEVFDSVGEFLSWLDPAGGPLPHLVSPTRGAGAKVEVCGAEPLTEDDEAIVQHLFRDSARVDLHPLGGGFSGARVFRTASQDPFGHEQAPSVLKLGPNALIGKERAAFEKVESILGNAAPRVRGFVDFGERAGLRYSYAAMGRGRIRTLKSLFEDGTPTEAIIEVLRTVTDEVFAPFFAAARYERLPLFAHYGFARAVIGEDGPRLTPELRYNDNVRRRVEEVLQAPAGPRIAEPGGADVMNPCVFYEDFLPRGRFPQTDAHYVATVHGDLNGANILIDPRDNVWVIDFFHTGPGHVWRDLIKLENDLLYLFTPIADEAALVEAMHITRALRAVQDLRAPLPETLPGLSRPELTRAWAVLRAIREVGARVTAEDRHPWQVALGLLRYAVHTLSFDEASPLQKRWALAAAGGWAQRVIGDLEGDRALRPGWLRLDGIDLPEGAGVGVVLCPGRRDRDRDLAEDLAVLRSERVAWLVGLITEPELDAVDVHDLPQRAQDEGIAYTLLRVPDQRVPTQGEALQVISEALTRLRRGERVVFHCLGGLGRSGTLAACTLTALGVTPPDAIARVREARGPRALETALQEEFVAQVAAQLPRGPAAEPGSTSRREGLE